MPAGWRLSVNNLYLTRPVSPTDRFGPRQVGPARFSAHTRFNPRPRSFSPRSVSLCSVQPTFGSAHVTARSVQTTPGWWFSPQPHTTLGSAPSVCSTLGVQLTLTAHDRFSSHTRFSPCPVRHTLGSSHAATLRDRGSAPPPPPSPPRCWPVCVHAHAHK